MNEAFPAPAGGVAATHDGSHSGTAAACSKWTSGREVAAEAPLPDELFALLTAHKEMRAKERENAGDEWHDGDWTSIQWKALLEETGAREARLHDARHTAATVLLLLGLPERVVMDLMGRSNTAMAKRYQHITAGMRRDVAPRLGGLPWGNRDPK